MGSWSFHRQTSRWRNSGSTFSLAGRERTAVPLRSSRKQCSTSTSASSWTPKSASVKPVIALTPPPANAGNDRIALLLRSLGADQRLGGRGLDASPRQLHRLTQPLGRVARSLMVELADGERGCGWQTRLDGERGHW